MGVCLIVLAGAFFLVRRQALKNSENFWSPPTRRVAQAMLPALLLCSLACLAVATLFTRGDASAAAILLIIIWTLLYSLALLSAGFFMPRGVRFFGLGFLIAGLILVCCWIGGKFPDWGDYFPHLLMGVIFGASHLAYGIYLYFTEPRKNET